MDILDMNATPQEPQRRPRGRPRLNPLPPPPPPQQENQNPPPPQQSEEPSISGTDNFDAVAASITPVIGDGTATPGAPAPGEVVTPGDAKIQQLLVGITPENVEKYMTSVFAAAARGFKMPELEPNEFEKGLIVPALTVIAQRELPEILKSMAAKYGEQTPEFAMLGTFVLIYGGRVALAQAEKKKKEKPKDGEKPWGKPTMEQPADTSPQVKPWGKPEQAAVGATGDSTTRAFQELPGL